MRRHRQLVWLFLLVPAVFPGCRRAHEGGTRAAVTERYTCPMHPAYVSDWAGDCPVCGMKLVPLGDPGPSLDLGLGGTSHVPPAREERPERAAVELDAERRRLIGLKTTPVRRAELGGELRTLGRIVFDETRMAKVQPRFEGYIEKLQADYTGKLVRKGQTLASIYSPELLATQQELLLASRGEKTLAAAGLGGAEDAARTRLRLLGIRDEQVDEIVHGGKPLRTLDVVAPISGYILTKNAVAGGRVTLDQPLFEIVDLSTVWLLADVYESELPRVRSGQTATATLSYWPARSWRGQVTYLYPTVDEKTRTVKVRVALPNPKGELRPEMYADVVIHTRPKSALVVPEEALLDTGTRKVAFVEGQGGRLEPREVVVGAHAGGLYEVASGLREGESVALGASFLLDSESRLKAAVSAMQSAAATPAAPAAPGPGDGGSAP